MAAQYGTVEISVFDNLNGEGGCDSCKTFQGAYVYCPVFNYIERDDNISFDETGELNRCELFSNKERACN